ncbi:MAG TPA: ATP-binding protein [Nitrospiraceae bacterium]|nr:ATP-binding protein [Nitrospiraceae bacterium]
MNKRISLQTSITLSVLLIGLLSGALGLGYAYWHAKQTRRTAIGLYFQELARQGADKVSLVLAKEIEWVERMSSLPEVREAVKEGVRLALDKPELQRWREEQSQYFRSLAIVDRNGRLVGGVTSKATRAHYAQQSWWPIVFEQRRSWAGDLRVDETGRGYWEVAVPISDEDGVTLGALKVAIGTEGLFASVLRTRIGQTGHVMLLDQSGHVLICPILPASLHTRTDVFAGGRDRAQPTRMGAAWVVVEDDSHGSRGGLVGVASVALPTPIAQERVWHILVRQAPEETYEPARMLMWKLAGFWIGTIGLIALLGWRLAHRIVRPLDALVERVRQLGEGQPTQRLETGEQVKQVKIIEIETLTSSFNRLADRLEKASRETQRYVGELERANLELANSEEHYRTLWNHAVDSKLIVNAKGTVQAMNRRAELKLGRRAEEVVGTAAADMFAEEDRARFHELLNMVLTTGKEGATIEVLVPTAAGSTLTMELDIVPIEGTGSDAAGLLQLSDITEKQQLAQQLLRSERLASLSQFASMFAHDIRNPLAGIKKTLELLSQQAEFQAEPQGRLFADLQFTTHLLLGMINDMLDVYQESYSGLPLVSSSFSVGALLEETAHLFRSEGDAKGVSILLELPDGEITFTGDRRRLQRVGINLVHNALKYSPSHGVITLSARVEREGVLTVPLDPPGKAVLLLQVRDEGPGVDQDELPHIFEMFFRKKDGHDLRIGRGLGLHFCRLVVETHGGRIWAANRPTGGAVFSVLLPMGGVTNADQARDS